MNAFCAGPEANIFGPALRRTYFVQETNTLKTRVRNSPHTHTHTRARAHTHTHSHTATTDFQTELTVEFLI